MESVLKFYQMLRRRPVWRTNTDHKLPNQPWKYDSVDCRRNDSDRTVQKRRKHRQLKESCSVFIRCLEISIYYLNNKVNKPE